MNALAEVLVDREAALHNVCALRSLARPGVKIAAVVKGNAYGHGLAEMVSILDGEVDYFQVDDIDELAALRKLTPSPSLTFGYVQESLVAEAIALGTELTVYDAKRLPAIAAAGKALGVRPNIHLKVDVMLGRQGLLLRDLPSFLTVLKTYPEIDVVAVYSHFANIEDTTDTSHAECQSAGFEQAFQMVRQTGWPDIARHESATSGLMTVESVDTGNSLVRLGIGLYGLYPSPALAAAHASLGLRPVMRWITHLAQVKTVPQGHSVGYGLTYVAPRDTKIGIVPQGYADGYDRGLSNRGIVLVHGQRCPVIGRVAMNMFAIDLTAAPGAQAEDEVTLIGGQGDGRVTADELADILGTISLEVVTRVASLLPRRIV